MKQSKRTPITLFVMTLVGLWLFLSAPGGTTEIKISTDTDVLVLPNFNLDIAFVNGLAFAVQVLALLASIYFVVVKNHKTPRYVVIGFATALVFEVLVGLFAGKTMTFTSLLQGSLALAVPLIFGSLAGVLSERVGVVNIAIEGQLLAGAFVSAFVASLADNLFAGLIGAIIAGTFQSLCSAHIRRLSDRF